MSLCPNELKIKSKNIVPCHLLAGHSGSLHFLGVERNFWSISQSTDSECIVCCELTLEKQAIPRCSQGLAAPGADSDVCSFLQ